MPALGPVWFTVKDIFFCLVCLLSPLLRWEGEEKEKVRINGSQTAEAKVCLALLPSPAPRPLAARWNSLSSLVLPMGGLEKLKRSSGCEGHSGKPQSLAATQLQAPAAPHSLPPSSAPHVQ